MAAGGIFVNELEMKMRCLAQALFDAGKEMETATIPAMCVYAGINYHSLKSRWSVSAGNRVSNAMQEKLAKVAGFKWSDSSWVDKSHGNDKTLSKGGQNLVRRDTAVEFERMIRRVLGLSPSKKVLAQAPFLVDPNLIKFQFDDAGQTVEAINPVRIFFEALISPGLHERGLVYGFNRVRIQFSFKPGTSAKLENLLALKATVMLGNATLSLRGRGYNAEWTLQAKKGEILEGEFATKDAPLAEIVNFEMDEVIWGELAVNLNDGYLTNKNGAELLPAIKKRIVERLQAEKLENASIPNANGWLTLGRQKLTIGWGS